MVVHGVRAGMMSNLPTFTALPGTSSVYCWTNRTTASDVLSTAVTVRCLPPKNAGFGLGFSRTVVGGGKQRETKKKKKKKPKSSFALLSFTKSKSATSGNQQKSHDKFSSGLPQVAFRVRGFKRSKQMVQERDIFMKSLYQERRARYELEEWAAIKLQRIVRGYLVRPKELAPKHDGGQEMTKDSLKQQLFLLADETKRQSEMGKLAGSHGDKDVAEWRLKAHRTALRAERKRRMREIERVATTLFQALARGFLSRRIIRAMRTRHILQQQQRACLALQCAWRSFAARRLTLSRQSKRLGGGAGNIQRMVRGHLGRKRSSSILRQRALEKRKYDGACATQALYRGFHARRYFGQKQLDMASTKVQGAFRLHKARSARHTAHEQRQVAASKIQAQCRGLIQRKSTKQYQLRQTARQQEYGAIKIQAVYRGGVDRGNARKKNEVRQQMYSNSATTIQCAFRSQGAVRRKNELATVYELKSGATQIQRMHRGYKGRREVETKRAEAHGMAVETSAVQIQALSRGHISRKRKREQTTEYQAAIANRAATSIQAQRRRKSKSKEIEDRRKLLTRALREEARRKRKSRRLMKIAIGSDKQGRTTMKRCTIIRM